MFDNNIIYNYEETTIVEQSTLDEVVNDMAFWGMSKEVLEQASELGIPAHQVAEANMGLGNVNDDTRFFNSLKQKEENRKYPEDLRNHKMRAGSTFGIIRDVYEHWLSCNESFMPVYPSYHNPHRHDILDLNEVPIRQIDNVTYKKGQPKYNQVEDRLIYIEVLVELARNKEAHWVRIFPDIETGYDDIAYWVNTAQGNRQVMPIYYNKRAGCYMLNQYMDMNKLKRWVKTSFPNIQIRNIQKGTISGFTYNQVTEAYYPHEDNTNPFFVEEAKHIALLSKLDMLLDDIDLDIDEVTLPAKKELLEIFVEDTKIFA